MLIRGSAWQDHAITSHYLAATVNPQYVCEYRDGARGIAKINRSESASSASYKAMPRPRIICAQPVLAHDVAARIDPGCNGKVRVRMRKVYSNEPTTPVSQITMGLAVGAIVPSHNIAGGIYVESVGRRRIVEID
jgi:hypothetical protein